MWVALFDFCLFVLFVSFFLYGLREWDHLLIDPDDEEAPARKGNAPHIQEALPPGRMLSLWVLIIGLGSVSLLWDLTEWMSR